MIFIAGAQPKKKQFRCTTTKHCFRCNNDTYWILQKQQQFITLFFLPVVPLKTTYFRQCPICGNTEELDRDTFDEKVRRGAEPYHSK